MADESLILRMRAMGGRASAAEVAANTKAVRHLKQEALGASRAFGSVTTAMGRNMATLTMWGRRAMATTVVLAGLGVKVGLEFNAMMEQQQIAFTSFLGSAPKAQIYLRRLYDLAAKTPFEFQDVVQGTRRLMSFGETAEGAYTTMRLLGDAIAATGGSAETISRATMALGQIRAAGVVHAQDLNQLIQAGVVSLPRLAKQMGMSTKDFREQMAEGEVGADRFFKALRKNWAEDPIYSGAAAKQAKTFTGQLSTFRDYARQTLGAVTFPLFEMLRTDGIPIASKFVKEINAIWNRELDLDVGTRIFMSRQAIRRHFQPLWEEAKDWYKREDVGGWLQARFNDTLSAFAVAAGNAAPRVAEAFFNAFRSANVWGKLFMAAWLLRITGMGGVFRWAGGKAAMSFATSFARTSMGTAVIGKYKMAGSKIGPVFGRAFALGAAAFVAVELGNELDKWAMKHGFKINKPGSPERDKFGKTTGMAEPWVRKNVPGANWLYGNVFDRFRPQDIGGMPRSLAPGTLGQMPVPQLRKNPPRTVKAVRRRAAAAAVAGGGDVVVHAPLYLDGKKVAEAVQRAARKKKSTR